MTTDRLWKAALDQLALRVSQGNFLTWFRNTRIREASGGKVMIETPSPFAYEWLTKKYRNEILEVLQSLDKKIESVDFCVSSTVASKKSLRRPTRIIAQKQPSAVGATATAQTVTPMEIEAPRSASPSPSQMQFNPKYTFATYVVGPSNEIAFAASQAVTTKPGEAYNPLFIYGGVGLGKTHLLQAVGNALLENNPGFKILYVSAEKFINDFVLALREKTTHKFKKFYREIDAFIIDDVQLLAGKDIIQEEMFHTFNSLHSQNKQVILSSDRPPTAIPTLQERLSSRLSAGMIADIKKPDYETRLAILEEKAKAKGVDFEPGALMFIAKNVQNNVRELEGALNRVTAYCELHNQKATLPYTQQVLSDLVEQNQHKSLGAKQIIEAVSAYYNQSLDEICGKCRKKEIVRPRQVAMFLLRKENNMSFPSIGEYFGGRDHTTAMHACEKIEKLLEHDEELGQEINFLKERLYA